MSYTAQNYCGPHAERYALYCPQCVRVWLEGLSPIERALVEHSGKSSPREAAKLVEQFRKLEMVQP